MRDSSPAILQRVAVAVAVAVALAACGGAGPPPRGPVLALRVPALDGGELDLATLRGRVVVLHVFDTGVAATIPDTTQLAELAAREPRRVAVVGIALDAAGYPVVAPWRRALGLRYVIALASPALTAGDSALGPIRVLPSTIVLDREGRLVERIERPLRPGEASERVRALLGG